MRGRGREGDWGQIGVGELWGRLRGSAPIDSDSYAPVCPTRHDGSSMAAGRTTSNPSAGAQLAPSSPAATVN